MNIYHVVTSSLKRMREFIIIYSTTFIVHSSVSCCECYASCMGSLGDGAFATFAEITDSLHRSSDLANITSQNTTELVYNAVKCDKKKPIKKTRNKLFTSTVYISNVDCEAIRARIALKLGSLLSFMIRNAFP